MQIHSTNSNAFPTGNPFWGDILLVISIGEGFGARRGLSVEPFQSHSTNSIAFSTRNPFLGDRLLVISVGKDFGALRALGAEPFHQ